MSKELVRNFNKCVSARAMWMSLERHFGKKCTSAVYHVLREVFALTQGDLSVTEFDVKVLQLWQEVDSLVPM